MTKEQEEAIEMLKELEMCAKAEIYHIGCPREDDLDRYMKCIKRYFENKAKEVE